VTLHQVCNIDDDDHIINQVEAVNSPLQPATAQYTITVINNDAQSVFRSYYKWYGANTEY